MELLSATGLCVEDEVLAATAKRHSGDDELNGEPNDADEFEGDEDDFDSDLDLEDDELLDDEEDEDA